MSPIEVHSGGGIYSVAVVAAYLVNWMSSGIPKMQSNAKLFLSLLLCVFARKYAADDDGTPFYGGTPLF